MVLEEVRELVVQQERVLQFRGHIELDDALLLEAYCSRRIVHERIARRLEVEVRITRSETIAEARHVREGGNGGIRREWIELVAVGVVKGNLGDL